MSGDPSDTQQPPPQPVYRAAPPGAEKKLAAGLIAILLPGLGIHKFILDMPVAGAIMLAITVSCGFFGFCLIIPILGAIAMQVISIAEGIIYLTKTDEEFVETYVVGKREWF
ncbi:TM2 domain-containing protein [Stratiformator vulcanicus]|uniref:TM2 domain protein n=1 Tax=Stratiformator vulcanicus TaxID=2527980 RepID=A0A517R7N4_9PLAN|nr:TM2 domain-containing protein [Stratiformator vulcanicus]QDT39900.1 TM2 domain protein [Stratiformator vulcanicus]